MINRESNRCLDSRGGVEANFFLVFVLSSSGLI